MKTVLQVCNDLRTMQTIPSIAAAAAVEQLAPVWERDLSNGEKVTRLLEDFDGVIEHLQAVKRHVAALYFTDVPRPALKQLDCNLSGNDYKFDVQSGHAGTWIKFDQLVAYLTTSGNQLSVGIYASHELCLGAPLSECHASQAQAKRVIKKALNESGVKS